MPRRFDRISSRSSGRAFSPDRRRLRRHRCRPLPDRRLVPADLAAHSRRLCARLLRSARRLQRPGADHEVVRGRALRRRARARKRERPIAPTAAFRRGLPIPIGTAAQGRARPSSRRPKRGAKCQIRSTGRDHSDARLFEPHRHRVGGALGVHYRHPREAGAVGGPGGVTAERRFADG